MVTLGVTYNYYQSSNNKDLLRFNNDVNRLQTSIENKINLYIALLQGGRGFIESAPDLNKEKFAEYVKSLDLEKNYSGVLGIGFTENIKPEEIEKLNSRMQAEGFADFTVFPLVKKDFYQPILYLEPLNDWNKKAIGYDMSVEENRRLALETARDTGNAVMTSKVVLVQENNYDTQPGFLIYLPIYKNGIVPNTIAERRNNLRGYIYSPFRANEFLKEIQEETSTKNIDIRVFDGAIKPENLLAQTIYPENIKFLSQFDEKYSVQSSLVVAGRKWTIEYDSSPLFGDQSGTIWTLVIFFSGMVFSFLLFGMIYWEAVARARLEKTTENLLEAEKQKAKLFDKEQKARLAAEQANKTKDEFIAVVSHELRTPLNAIAGWTRILKTPGISDNTKKIALSKIEKNLKLQTQMVEELLDYSQIISENSALEGKPVDLSSILDASCAEAKDDLIEKDINLIKNNTLNGHRTYGDEAKLKIVISNLLSNAIKFTCRGGTIEASLFNDEENVYLAVKDSGKGISPKFLPYIFDRFRQADASTTRSYGGLGLGLTITSHIVEQHKGSIEAYSEGEGKGATFTVKLPNSNN